MWKTPSAVEIHEYGSCLSVWSHFNYWAAAPPNIKKLAHVGTTAWHFMLALFSPRSRTDLGQNSVNPWTCQTQGLSLGRQKGTFPWRDELCWPQGGHNYWNTYRWNSMASDICFKIIGGSRVLVNRGTDKTWLAWVDNYQSSRMGSRGCMTQFSLLWYVWNFP